MKCFDVLRATDGRMVAIQRGWSWPGFWFGPAWAFTKRQYALGVSLAILPTCIIIGGRVLLSHCGHATPAGRAAIQAGFQLVGLGLMAGMGKNVNRLFLNALVRQGWERMGSVLAVGPKGAMANCHASSSMHPGHRDGAFLKEGGQT